MFDRPEDQIIYEETKQQLEKENYNTSKKSNWKKYFGVATLLIVVGFVAIRKWWKMQIGKGLREHEMFSHLFSNVLEVEELARWSEDEQN